MGRFSTYTPDSPPEMPEIPEMTLPEFEDCLPKARLELLPGGGRIVCEKCCKPPKPICITTECPPGATSCVGRKRRDAEDRMCYIKPEECGEEKCTPLMIRPRPAPGFIRPDLARPGIDRPQ